MAIEPKYHTYTWSPHPKAAYYFVTMKVDGKDLTFKTTDLNVQLDYSNPILIRVYDKKDSLLKKMVVRAMGPTNRIKAEKQDSEELKETIKEVEPDPYDKYLDEEEYEEEDEDPDNSNSIDPEENIPKSRSPYKTLSTEVEMQFGLGREKIKLLGGISKLDSESNIGDTSIAASICLGKEELCQWNFKLRLRGHKFSSTYTEGDNTEETKVEFLALRFGLQSSYQWNFSTFYLRSGVVIGTRTVPVFEMIDPIVGSSKIDKFNSGIMQLHLGAYYLLFNNQQLEFEINYGLFAMSLLEEYSSKYGVLWWRYFYSEKLSFLMGADYENYNAKYEIDCGDGLENCVNGSIEDEIIVIRYGASYSF